MAAERFTFYLSFLKQINKMPEEDQLSAYRAICEYALLGKEPDFSQDQTAYADIVFTGIRPILDSGQRKAENGRKGGAGEAEEKRSQAKEKRSTAKDKRSTVMPGEKPKQTRSKRQAKPKQTTSKTEANVKQLEEEVEKEIETEGEKNIYRTQRKTIREEFEELWQMMPKKRGSKAKALEEYAAARGEGTDFTDVQLGINRYKAHIKARDVQEDYVLNASTFFKDRRWLDDWSSHRPRDRDGFAPHEYDWDQLEKDVTT